MKNAKILVIDSGVGGLSVTAHIRQHCPDVIISYIADTSHFPYGSKTEAEVTNRIQALVEFGISRDRPDLVVIACNTASTIVLNILRATYKLPFVGVVPAIKPAAAKSQSGVIGVLATHGTVNRRYTRDLIASYAKGMEVLLHGSSALVELSEQKLRGGTLEPIKIQADIEELFWRAPKIDTVVLACTHFPLLLSELQSLFPSVINWVDSGDAIARRVKFLLGELPTQTEANTRVNQLLLTATPAQPYLPQLIYPLLGEFELQVIGP